MAKSKKKVTSKVKLSNKHSNKGSKRAGKKNLDQSVVNSPKLKQFSKKTSANPKKKEKELLRNKLFSRKFINSIHEDDDDAIMSDQSSSAEITDDVETRMFKKKRKFGNVEDDDGTRLPIKGKSGVYLQKTVDSTEAASQEVDTKKELEETIVETKNEPLDWTNILLKKKKEIMANKIEIGTLSQSILENPEVNICHMKKLIAFCEKEQPLQIRKLSIISLTEIFKDIIPSYQIRELSDVEKGAQMKKDTVKLFDYEETLLSSYKDYLQVLEENIKEFEVLWKKRRKTPQQNSHIQHNLSTLAFISTKSMASLLSTNPHFNYRNNIVLLLVTNIHIFSAHPQICKLCKETLRDILWNDKNGEISLEIIRVVHNMVKNNHNITPQLLEPLLSLKINVDILHKYENKMDKNEKKDYNQKLSRKQKKRKKVEDKLNKELHETEAVERKENIAKTYLEITKLLFATYFRVIKLAGIHTSILSIVLKGLSRFSHCISLEFMDPIISTLKNLVKADICVMDKLSCVSTIMKILSGQGELLLLDPTELYQEFYKLMLELTFGLKDEDVQLYNDCLDIMLIKRRKQLSTSQLQGFFKRISTMLLHVDKYWIDEWLTLLRKILQHCSRCSILLDNEECTADLLQVDFFHTQCLVLWDFLLLEQHYCKEIGVYVKQQFLSHTDTPNVASRSQFLKKRSLSKEASSDFCSYLDNINPPSMKKRKLIEAVPYSDSFDNYLRTVLDNVNKDLQGFFPELLKNKICFEHDIS